MKLIRKALAFVPVLLLLANTYPLVVDKSSCHSIQPISILTSPLLKHLAAPVAEYDVWNLRSCGLSRDAFEMGLKGYNFFMERNRLKKTNILTIIDYSQPSSKRRLYVLDMQNKRVIFNTLVAHGLNSGYNYARSFSNDEESFKSSLGFFITRGTYTGLNGYSLKLEGCEKGINNNALDRAIVLHGAGYVSEDFLRSKGYLGRSLGCPAVPLALAQKIIDKIKNGSCMFLYHQLKTYTAQSKILDS